MDKTGQDQQQRGLDLGCSARTAAIVVALLIVTFATIWLLSQLDDSQGRELAQERAEALQPWNIALAVTLRAILIGAGVILLAGLAGATQAAVGLLNDKRRTIQPKDGMFPARVLRPGESLADLNRSPDGKIQAAPAGWLAALLLRLAFGHRMAEELSRPAIAVLPHDTSPAQLRITSQAQVVQAFAASPGTAQPQAPQVGTMPLLRPTQQLPPLVALDQAPDEIRLLVEAGQRNWDRRGDDVALQAVDYLEQ